MNNPTFTPKPIGSPDTQRENQVINLYQDICDNATGLKAELEMMFSSNESIITNEFLFDLMKSDPEKRIRTLWVQHNQIKLPGVNMERFINSDLLDIPKYDEIIQSIKGLKELYSKSKSYRFYFPLEKLVDINSSYFSLNDEFHSILHESGIVYTQSQEQNELLEAVEQFKNSINTLCNLKVMQPGSAAQRTQLLLFSALKRKPGAPEDPYELNPNMFNTSSMLKLVDLV